MQLTGLEPATFRFVAGCSIQLSYSYIYENIIKHIYNIFNMKFIFKGNFRGKLARSTLKPFNINNYKIVCVRFVALHSIQLNYERIYNTFILYDVFLVFSRELWKIFKILMSLINERKTLSF